jgi:hypothetical protein
MSQDGDVNPDGELPADFLVRFAAGAYLVTWRDHERMMAFNLSLLTLDGLATALEAAIANPDTVWIPYQSIVGKKKRDRLRSRKK